ncbi:MAG TPA: hypothetical protein DDW84_04315 [Phycisphaerales bacterium]|nr:MAG: hypothetical protein A2Y13_12030 [Planctomycetes bacterium GWC2_45_44]HBG78060.1 hypothetical protein [Phycisphaerales bacterium]HBR20109.1 hypothetical protein [Phycisphaerales bacterium]
MNKSLFCVCVLGVVVIAGCNKEAKLTDSQIRQFQAKDLQGTFDSAYKSTLQVFQDYGYVIKNSDFNSGVIQGETGSKKDKNYFWNGKMINTEATATLEQFDPNTVKARLSLVNKTKVLGYYNYENTEKIIDSSLYQKMYDDIQKEMFVRQNINK